MTPKDRAAMKQALEALENERSHMTANWDNIVRAITALREALAEQANNWPENEEHKRQLIEGQRKWLAEPDMNLNCKSVQARLATLWGYVKAEQAEQEPVAFVSDVYQSRHTLEWNGRSLPVGTRLYAAPVRTKDYNPEVTFNDDGTFSLTLPDGDELRIIPPQQEPTAEVSEEGYAWGKDGILPAGTKLYLHPVRTKDLTDDEVIEICKDPATSPCKPWWLRDDVVFQDIRDAAMRFASAVIAADREKNK